MSQVTVKDLMDALAKYPEDMPVYDMPFGKNGTVFPVAKKNLGKFVTKNYLSAAMSGDGGTEYYVDIENFYARPGVCVGWTSEDGEKE